MKMAMARSRRRKSVEAKYRHRRLSQKGYEVIVTDLQPIGQGWTPERLESFSSAYHRSGKDKSDWQPHGRGGITYCQLVEDGEVVAQGVAYCSPKDNFCYRVGRDIARGRAEREYRRMNHGV